MSKIEDIIAKMRRNPKGIRFRDVCKVCDFYFGEARQKGSSHRIYKTPWQGDPSQYPAWFTSTEKLLYKFGELQRAIGGSQRRNLPIFALNGFRSAFLAIPSLVFDGQGIFALTKV